VFFCITKYAQYLNYYPQNIFGEFQKTAPRTVY